MNKEVLNKILENHQHWCNQDVPGWESMRANLFRADLSGANLFKANLSGANLYGAYLCGADLSGADLSGANLYRADLSRADLSEANLSRADLSEANLYGANLYRADLSRADLSEANLYGADLSEANLYGANLYGSNLYGADLGESNLYGADLGEANLSRAILHGANVNQEYLNLLFPIICPKTGSFIAWKRAHNFIVKLEVLSDAKRSSAFGRKCRCSAAKCLAIENLDGTDSGLQSISSTYDSNFIYKIGEVSAVENFETDRTKECAPGIHFFITRNEAVNYNS